MSDKSTDSLVQLNVDTEELYAACSPDRPRVLTAVDRTVLLLGRGDRIDSGPLLLIS